MDFWLIYDIGGFTNQEFKNELPRYLMVGSASEPTSCLKVGSKNEPTLRADLLEGGFKERTHELPRYLLVGSTSEPILRIVGELFLNAS